MADSFFDEKDIVKEPTNFKSVEKKEELSSFFDESDVLSEEEVYGMSAPTGALIGAAAGKSLEMGSEILSDKAKKTYLGAKQLPILGDLLKSAEYASEGESVVGKKQREKIVKESEKAVEKLSDTLEKQKKQASTKIGKVISLVDKKLDPTNINQDLNKIEKSIKSIKAPTEQGQKTLENLEDLLNQYKETRSEYSIKAKGKVKTGIEEATEKLQSIKNKLLMEAEELGELKTFGPTKIDEKAKRIGSLDIQSGKLISTPIKSGEFTPIDITKTDTNFFKKMSVDELKNLQRALREVKESADVTTQSFSEAIKAENKIKEILEAKIKEGLGEKGLNIYKSGAKEYVDVQKAYKLFPELKKEELGKINISDFFRRLESESMSSDKKSQILNAVFDKIKQDPEKLQKFNSEIVKLSDRYNLSELSTKFGLESTSLRNIAVRTGDILGKAGKVPKAILKSKPVKTGIKAALKSLPLVGAIIGGAITYDESIAAGATPEQAIKEATSQELLDTVLGPLYLEKSGPMIGSIERKLESGEELTEEEKKQLYDFNNKAKEIIKKNPEKANFNAMADKIAAELGDNYSPIVNQFRNLELEKDPRKRKIKTNMLLKSPGYKKVEEKLNKITEDLISNAEVSNENNSRESQGIESSQEELNLPSLEMPSLLKETEESDAVDRAASSPFMGKRVEDFDKIKNLTKNTKDKEIIKQLQKFIGTSPDGNFYKKNGMSNSEKSLEVFNKIAENSTIDKVKEALDIQEELNAGMSKEEAKNDSIAKLESLMEDYNLQKINKLRPILDLIAKGEGTTEEKANKKGYDSPYDVTLGYGLYDPEPKDGTQKIPITKMTLKEIDDFQTGMLQNPKNKINSSAIGKYQIIRTTLRKLKKKLNLKDTDIFTPELQDKLASHLLFEKRKMNDFLLGNITSNQFQQELAKEWASIANPNTNKSYYGQATGVKNKEIQPILNSYIKNKEIQPILNNYIKNKYNLM